MGYKPTFKVYGDPQYYENAQVFATKKEALDSAAARFMVWTMAENYKVIETPDPVNYRFEDGRDIAIR